MSFLLFASRKIQIRRELNTKNYELDLITQKYNEATKAVADFQQNISNAKQMTSVLLLIACPNYSFTEKRESAQGRLPLKLHTPSMKAFWEY